MPAEVKPLRIVSVSLGSSKRDSVGTAEFLGREVQIERRGTNGDMARAIALIAELDGKVDAIGLGGIDLYLVAAGKKFVIRDALRLARAAKITPVVDGSGLKHTLERRTLLRLQEEGAIDFRGKRVFLVAGVDRFGMAETFPELGAVTRYGDLMFSLGIPIPINSLGALRLLARTLLPVICRLPFSWLYPIGEKQNENTPKFGSHFAWAEIIAGDFPYILRYMPPRLDGKIILTNTTTADDVERLRNRGASMLVSTTPDIGGRSFGTNAMEGVIVSLAGKRPEEMTPRDYETCLEQLGWSLRVVRLQDRVKSEV